MTRYIGKQPAFGNFVKLDAISVVNGQAAYTMQSGSSNFTNYDNVNQFIVSLNGVIQAPTDSFTVSGSTITFASALSTGDVINFILVLGDVLSVGTPSDNTVSTAKIQNTAVNADKLATDAVQTAKIQNDAVTTDKINLISTSSTPSLEAKGTSGQTDGYIQLNCEQNSHGIKLKSPPHSAGQSYTLTFPSTAPTNDKFLKTNSSGVLSFAEVGGGDYVKLSSTTPSAANTFSIDGHFTSDYDVYKIYAIGMSGSSMSNTRISMRVNVGGSAQSSSNYYYHTNIQAGTSVNGNWSNSSSASHSDLGYLHNSSGSTAQAHFELTIFRPLASDMTSILHDAITADNGTGWGRYSGFTAYTSATAISGITLSAGAFGSGNIEADRILVYGLKI